MKLSPQKGVLNGGTSAWLVYHCTTLGSVEKVCALGVGASFEPLGGWDFPF